MVQRQISADAAGASQADTDPFVESAQPDSQPVVGVTDGYDSFQFDARSSAISGMVREDGGRKIMRYRTCTTTDELMEAMNISTSIGGSYDFLESASAKARYFQKLTSFTKSVSVVVYVARFGTEVLSNPALLAGVDPTRSDFFAIYGDSYVASVDKGGELIATYSFYCETEDSAQKVVASLKANGIGEEGTFDANFATKIEQAEKDSTVAMTAASYLGGYANERAPDPNENSLFDFAARIYDTAPDAPLVLNFTIEGYERVQDFIRTYPWFRTIVENRDLLNQGDPATRNPSLKAIKAQLRSIDNEIAQILAIYDLYGVEVDQKALEKARKDFAEKDQIVLGILHNMQQFPLVPATAPSFPPLQTPVLNFRAVAIEQQWGGDGGDPFDDVAPSMARQARRVAFLQLRGDLCVDALLPTYVAIGVPPISYQHGMSGGSASNRLEIRDGQRLLRMSGEFRDYDGSVVLTLLRFEFDDAEPLAYPPEDRRAKGGTPFDRSFAADEALIGFVGRSGKFLDQIRPIVVQFLPVDWR